MIKDIEEIKRVIKEGECSRGIIDCEVKGEKVRIFSAVCEVLNIPLQSNENEEGCNCPTCINWSRAKLFDEATLMLEYQQRLIELSNNWAKKTKPMEMNMGINWTSTEEEIKFVPLKEEDIDKLLASLMTTNDLATSDLAIEEQIEEAGEFADNINRLNSEEWSIVIPRAGKTMAASAIYDLAS